MCLLMMDYHGYNFNLICLIVCIWLKLQCLIDKFPFFLYLIKELNCMLDHNIRYQLMKNP